MLSHGQPISFVCCDNIPANGVILEAVVRALAGRARRRTSSRWIDGNVAFPSTMVDRIVPATAPADIDAVESSLRLSRQRRGGRRAVPAMGDRGPLRRPDAALGRSPAPPSSTT